MMTPEKMAADLFKPGFALKISRKLTAKVMYHLSANRDIEILEMIRRIESSLDAGSVESAKRRLNELAAVVIAPAIGLGEEVYVEYGVRRDAQKVTALLRRELKNANELQASENTKSQTITDSFDPESDAHEIN